MKQLLVMCVAIINCIRGLENRRVHKPEDSANEICSLIRRENIEADVLILEHGFGWQDKTRRETQNKARIISVLRQHEMSAITLEIDLIFGTCN